MPSRNFTQANSSNKVQFQTDRTPDRCPVCHSSVVPIETSSDYYSNSTAEVTFRCPRISCSRFFIARFTVSGGAALLQECVPATPFVTPQPKLVADISPSFIKIYGQAEAAEAQTLSEIAGVGYRRALEFLIKDYLISQYEDAKSQEDIRGLFLGRCIEKYVKNDNLKVVAKRAVWLGNDETHYVRLWEGKDIKDLKGLIALTVNWIEMELRTLELQKDMPERK
jgi:hypothetical protein